MDSIITIDSSHRVLMFNSAAEKMFRCAAKEAIGQPLDRFIPARFRSTHSQDIRKFGDTGVTTRAMGSARSVSGLRADGQEFPMEASISQIEVQGHRLYTVIMRDITERKQAEGELRAANQHLERTLSELEAKRDELAGMTQQLWQASKLATLGELSASIAHELNNPLATLALRADLLKVQLPPDDSRQQAVKIISEEVDRMANLVANLLQFSRRTHTQTSTLDIREELTNAIDLIHYHLRSHKIEVVQEFSDALPAIQGDRQQLRQVFLNLLTNASDAMPDGGTLLLRARQRGNDNQSFVVVEFVDTGVGISPDELEKVWETFFTTKPEGKGTGLGLPICRRTVEEHRGTISIDSKVGEGTTVRIVLPAIKTPTEEMIH
jgi:PAS domain S-box-containing protein